MASKYDRFWQERLPELQLALAQAAIGEVGELDVGAIKHLGRRTSWHGSTRVRNGELLAGNMAHAVSLGRQIIQSRILTAWPQTEFILSISDGGRLTVRAGTVAARTARDTAHVRDHEPAPIRGEVSIATPAESCRRIHEALATLPQYHAPSEVPFTNGLYFFYERSERSDHGTVGRVVRIGNHPHSQNRLTGRLSDHYRTALNAKNGSVFRRYLGGALIRRRDPESPCLGSVPGRGHWEHGKDPECPRCGSVEEEVTAYLTDDMVFRCVAIDNLKTRNKLEKALIATVAQCPICHPSAEWLGNHAYPGEVRSTGLWNVQYTGNRAISDQELRLFEAFAEAGPQATAPAIRTTQGRTDLSDTLLVIPCSGGKDGAQVPDLPLRKVVDYLDTDTARLLQEGRDEAFARQHVHVDARSPLRPAIATYSGQPFAAPGFRNLLLDAMEKGLHCLIVSGGYGLVRPEELIHQYKAHMPSQTRGVWTRRLARLLPAYVKRNGIRRAFIAVSRSYASCLPEGFAQAEWWGVPEFDPQHDHGSAMRVVPAKVGGLLVSLLSDGMEPGPEWRRAS